MRLSKLAPAAALFSLFTLPAHAADLSALTVRGPEQAQNNIRIEVSARVGRNIFGQILTFNRETP